MNFRGLKWARPSAPILFTLLALLIAIPVTAMYFESLRVNVTVETGEFEAIIGSYRGFIELETHCCDGDCSCECCSDTTTTTTTTATTTTTNNEHGENCACYDCCVTTDCVGVEEGDIVLGPNAQYLDFYFNTTVSDNCCDCCDGNHVTTHNEAWIGIVFENTGTIPVTFKYVAVTYVGTEPSSWGYTTYVYGPISTGVGVEDFWGNLDCEDLPIDGNVIPPVTIDPGEKLVFWINIVVDDEGDFLFRLTPVYVPFNQGP